MAFAERFAKESFTEVDDFVNATAGEFLNVNDGLFVVNESNEHGVELTLTPQKFLENGELALSGTAFCIPVNYPFGKLNSSLPPDIILQAHNIRRCPALFSGVDVLCLFYKLFFKNT